MNIKDKVKIKFGMYKDDIGEIVQVVYEVKDKSGYETVQQYFKDSLERI